MATAKTVDEYMRTLDHPLKPGLESVRATILRAHPKITEEIKWNAPSFRFKEVFATASIRKDAVFIILHLGAKVTSHSKTGLVIRDPAGLLEWLARDRAAVSFPDLKAVAAGRAALADIVKQWITHIAS